jgi:hypothetical protein
VGKKITYYPLQGPKNPGYSMETSRKRLLDSKKVTNNSGKNKRSLEPVPDPKDRVANLVPKSAPVRNFTQPYLLPARITNSPW